MSRASAEYVRSMWESIGVIVMGRRLFDLVNGCVVLQGDRVLHLRFKVRPPV